MLHSSRAATRPACFLEERGEYEYCAIHGSDHCDVSHQRTVWWDAPTAAQPQLSELSVKNGGRAIAATPPRSTTAGTNSLSVSPCLCPCPPPPSSHAATRLYEELAGPPTQTVTRRHEGLAGCPRLHQVTTVAQLVTVEEGKTRQSEDSNAGPRALGAKRIPLRLSCRVTLFTTILCI